MKYTDSQKQAIYKSGKNILVSASAGSGKTGVLKKRVIEKIVNGIDIDQLVILTFTEAAAAEMKARIVKEIHELKLKDQLAKVDNAIISTFDAFTLRLVKEYHYLLGLSKNIEICDQVLLDIHKDEVIKEVLKRHYIESSEEFVVFFKKYYSKSDQWLIKTIKSIGEQFRKDSSYLNTINNYENIYFDDLFIENTSKVYLEAIISDLNTDYNYFNETYLSNNFSDEKYEEYLNEINSIVMHILDFKNYDEFILKMTNISMPRKKGNKELVKPEIVDKIKSITSEFKELFITSFSDLKESYLSTKNSVLVLLDLVKEYLIELEEVKKHEELYSFDDIMFFAIKLFKEFPNVKEHFKNKIKEILVDEYQDTNDLQDEFISLIASDNVFMVGDVKQSIYRFRNANPKNFMRIYNEYSAGLNGEAIFLQENFRSNKYVLDAINKIFMKIMTESTGGVEYKNEQVLISGFDDDFSLHNQEALSYILYEYNKIIESDEKLDKEKIEAHLVAQNILKRISEKHMIYSMKDELNRPVKYEDITILVDRKTNFQEYSKVISMYNIPIDIYDDEPFFSSDEIRFIFQYLILINCFKNEDYFKKYFKSSLYSVSRSFVYRISDQEISEFFLMNKSLDFKSLNILEDTEGFKVIYDDIMSIISKSWDLPSYKVLENIYDQVRIYKKIAYLANPGQKEEKLDFFLAKVKSFSNFTYQDLIEYLEVIINGEDFDIQYAQEKKSVNAVKLMSMHKSKGLQFPIVYLMGLYKQFFNGENKEPFIFDKKYGVLTKAYSDGFYNQYLRKLYLKTSENEELSEKIRLLYVAMTRAVNELVLVVDYDESLTLKDKSPVSFKNLLYKVIDFDRIDFTDFKIENIDSKKKDLPVSQETVKMKSLDFDTLESETVRYSKEMLNLLEDDEIRMIESGNHIHHLMENVDFNNIDYSIKNFPDSLKESILYLVNSDYFKKLSNPKFYQEYEFYEETGNVIYRGIIDLLIIADNQVITIDYKLKSIEDEAYEKQLLGYFKYLNKKINKPIKLLLYSLIDKRFKEVHL